MPKLLLALCTIFYATIYLTTATANGMYILEEVSETIGYVQSLEKNILHVVGEPLTVNGYASVAVDISHAPIYDLRTGFLVDQSHITKNMGVRVAYEHDNAIVVWLNEDYEDAAVFTAEVSENIMHYDDYSVFLSADGKYRISLTQDTIILDPLYGELLPSEIIPGMEFFIWVDMITASSPSLVYPDKVVVVYD